MRRLRALFGFALISAALAGGWLAVRRSPVGRPVTRAHVMDRRCRGGCLNSALMWILQGGPTSAQIGAGSLTASNGSSVTATRASNRTCSTSSGVVILSANQPCVTPFGLSIEGAATNLAIWSQDTTNAAWSGGGGTRAATATTAPDGTLTGNSFTSDTSTGLHRIIDTAVSVTSGQTYTTSIFVKAGAWNYISTTLSSAGTYAVFDLSLVAVSSTAGGAAGSISTYGNGWYRVATTETAPATTTFSPVIYFGDTAAHAIPATSFTGTSVVADYVFGLQVETGTRASTYIATTGTSATRAADDIRVANPLSGVNPTSWSMAASVIPFLLSGTQGVVSFGTSSAAANTANLRIASGVVNCDVYDSTGTGLIRTTTATISNATHRLACQNNNGTVTILVDGAVASSTVSGTGTGIIATQSATAMLGQIQTGGTNPLWGQMTDVCIAKTAGGCF